MPGIKSLESLKVWKDIRRAFHPFGQKDGERRDGAEDLEAGRLRKVEYRVRARKTQLSEVWRRGCGDCSHERLKGIAKITVLGHLEGLKAVQRLHNGMYLLVFSRWWK